MTLLDYTQIIYSSSDAPLMLSGACCEHQLHYIPRLAGRNKSSDLSAPRRAVNPNIRITFLPLQSTTAPLRVAHY